MAFEQKKVQNEHPARLGILQARPTSVSAKAFPAGLHPLKLDDKRDALCYVPSTHKANTRAPLIVMLHGAGGTAHNGLAPLLPLADKQGLLLLAPASRLSTWDMIVDSYGPDVSFLDQALTQLFQRYRVDAGHLALGGFSDGASYALSLGLSNGNLFTHIIAFSPGFMRPTQYQGKPYVYISHGRFDTVLPIDRCSRVIVPRLKREGYEVKYHEFNGIHTIPSPIVHEAIDWFLGKHSHE
ncbi:phospholipase [Ktedonosporobacter rubrisoli]|uniref:Phospholipase n=1 Tax=Ktedonosporobacter rubrisoli TaxID=2509675 RepID=A0A4P6JMQ3_KTERU|nr:phospholipase [Ktedonosporobacter rubrisoli]QBD76524.1 phospholipase [Ktedonosporobacter rubrisoli]